RDVQWVHAEGDYSRLHTDDGAHLVRLPISELDERWAPHGFVRVHRSYLVRIAAITEARLTGGEPVVVVADAPPLSIPVSRRMLPAVRESLVRAREAGR
uniref:LytTR family DNA-binding domain-containing protein n=3 Tax=Microbacterium TaxID=33882 RepID=UPI001F581571